MTLSLRPTAAFLTKEQLHAQTTGSLKSYWRLSSPLCAKFLKLGKDPTHFPAVRAFFPFIRDASVLQISRTFNSLPCWLNLAFHAGYLFATEQPAETEHILESNRVESAEALRRLGVLKSCLGRCPATPRNLYKVFEHICKVQWCNVPAGELLAVLMTASFNAFKAGLTAATIAKADPFLAEFLSSIKPALAAPQLPLSWRALILSPSLAYGQPLSQSLTHPLLKLAATNYPHTPLERETILPFFIQQLWASGQPSEDKCRTAERHIVEWVRNALEYGRRMKSKRPQRVAEIFAEIGANEVKSISKLVSSIVEQAGGTEPGGLAAAILDWHNQTHERTESPNYGRRLERVIHCVDFAIWIPWVHAGTD